MKVLIKMNLLFVFLLAMACSNEGSDPTVVAPTDLQISVTQSETAAGKISITATANDANYYDFDFGDGLSEKPLVDNDGMVDYTYAQQGNYTITVRAFATADVFTTATSSTEITFEEEPVDDEGYTTPMSYDGYTLVWNDEFQGSELSDDWTFEIGTGSNGWGNNELEYYREENTTVKDDHLIIEARKESFGGQSYTSSRIITKGKKEFKYGRIDIRAILPQGQGVWPALWLLGSNISSVGWPKSGEIDLMEKIGGTGNESTVYGTLHWDNNGSHACTCDQGNGYTLSSGIFADKFHVFSLAWDASAIKWYVDDELYETIDITPSGLSEFQEEFFFIFNVAVGGDWPGSPDSTTQFPQKMTVDYIRVFQEN